MTWNQEKIEETVKELTKRVSRLEKINKNTDIKDTGIGNKFTVQCRECKSINTLVYKDDFDNIIIECKDCDNWEQVS